MHKCHGADIRPAFFSQHFNPFTDCSRREKDESINSFFLGYNVPTESQPVFWKDMLLPSSELKNV
jgi:hypothetical protein